MQIYLNISGRSAISHYELGQDYINVRFMNQGKDGNNTYKYTVDSVGSGNITQMHELAKTGMGLGGFIQRNVRKNYSEKWYSNA